MSVRACFLTAGRFLAACAVLVLVAVQPSLATSSPRDVTWENLLPKLPPLVDPLAAMDADQRIELETILWVRQLSDAEREQRPEVVEEAKLYEQNFVKKGISIDKLVKDYAAWSSEIDKRQQMVEPSLDGQAVKIKGYLLPIEFSEDGVSDFLLVPYVGACIHVPAPPANQIVFVRLPERLKVTDLYTPVELTGQMSATASNRKLNLADGSAGVDVGYALTAGNVKVLQE